MARPRFFAPDARAGARSVVLSAEEAHHLRHVLRLDEGASIAVFDGDGHEWEGRVTSIGRSDVTVDLVAPIEAVREPAVRVVLAVGLLKADQMDAVVRDATALGVAAIAPTITAHVAVPERAWSDKVLGRWRRVAVAAAKQCGRAVVPAIAPVESFESVVGRTVHDLVVIGVEPAQAGPDGSVSRLARPSAALLLCGPEGGWSKAEVDLAAALGARRLSLGPRTLRAETAPVVLLSALWTEWGWD